jgi:hypothetical protein
MRYFLFFLMSAVKTRRLGLFDSQTLWVAISTNALPPVFYEIEETAHAAQTHTCSDNLIFDIRVMDGIGSGRLHH